MALWWRGSKDLHEFCSLGAAACCRGRGQLETWFGPTFPRYLLWEVVTQLRIHREDISLHPFYVASLLGKEYSFFKQLFHASFLDNGIKMQLTNSLKCYLIVEEFEHPKANSSKVMGQTNRLTRALGTGLWYWAGDMSHLPSCGREVFPEVEWVPHLKQPIINGHIAKNSTFLTLLC